MAARIHNIYFVRQPNFWNLGSQERVLGIKIRPSSLLHLRKMAVPASPSKRAHLDTTDEDAVIVIDSSEDDQNTNFSNQEEGQVTPRKSFANKVSKFRFSSQSASMSSIVNREETSRQFTTLTSTASTASLPSKSITILSSSDEDDDQLRPSSSVNPPMSPSKYLPSKYVSFLKACPVCKLLWTTNKPPNVKRQHFLQCAKSTGVTDLDQLRQKLENCLRQSFKDQQQKVYKSQQTVNDRPKETLLGTTLSSMKATTINAVGVDDASGAMTTDDLQKYLDERRKAEKVKRREAGGTDNNKNKNKNRNKTTSKQQGIQLNLSSSSSFSDSDSQVDSQVFSKLQKIVAEIDEKNPIESKSFWDQEEIRKKYSGKQRKRYNYNSTIYDNTRYDEEDNDSPSLSPPMSTQAMNPSKFNDNMKNVIHSNSNSDDASSSNSLFWDETSGVLLHEPLNLDTDLSDDNRKTTSTTMKRHNGNAFWNLAATNTNSHEIPSYDSMNKNYFDSSPESSSRKVYQTTVNNNDNSSDSVLSSPIKRVENITETFKHVTLNSPAKSFRRSYTTTTSPALSQRRKNTESEPEPEPESSTKPDFWSYTLIELQKEVDKFGFKKSRTKGPMIEQLEKVWESLHRNKNEPYFEQDNFALPTTSTSARKTAKSGGKSPKKVDDIFDVSDSPKPEDKAKAKATKTTKTKKSTSSSPTKSRTKKFTKKSKTSRANSEEDEDEQDDGIDELDVSEVKEAAKTDIQTHLINAIVDDNDLYMRVLRYEPIRFEEFETLAKSNSIKISKVALRNFLDSQCVSFYHEATTNNRRQKSKKKQPDN